jgi:hypothetical protein
MLRKIKIKKMAEAGMSFQSIGDYFGLSKQYVHTVISGNDKQWLRHQSHTYGNPTKGRKYYCTYCENKRNRIDY